MRRTEKQKKSRKSWAHRFIAVAVMVAAFAALLSQTVFAQNSYVITDGDNVTVHKSFSTDPDVVLHEAGIELSEEDTYTTTYNDGVSCIDIQRMQMVTIVDHGEKSVIGTYGETVSSLLERAGIVLDEGDVLSCQAESMTYDGLTVEVVHKEVALLEYSETIPCPVNYYEDPELAPGEEIVLVEGVDGVVQYNAEVVYENGVEVSRTIKTENVVTDAVTRLVVKGPDRAIADQPADVPLYHGDNGFTVIPNGDENQNTPEEPSNEENSSSTQAPTEATQPDTAPSVSGGILTTSSGVSYEYVDVLNVSCTAYSCNGNVGYTYSGTLARVGAVAVDPNYIPLGTRMYIVSNDGQYIYGYCVAEDIGGGIKGYKVDLYFNTFSECYQFGVRNCTAYILR